MTTSNARIDSTFLGREDHGIFTAFLYLDYGGGGQGFGGYVLKDKYAYVFVSRVLETVGASSWENLPGKHVRVCVEQGKALGIGHIIEDKWYFPEREWEGEKR